MTIPFILGGLSLQVAIATAVFEGYRRRDGAIVVNAAASLAVALSVTLVGTALDVDWTAGAWPVLSLWVSLAGFLHCLGMLGRYESVWWWDHLTHTVSGTLFAALLYAGLLVSGPPVVAAAVTVGATLVAGVCWELVELLARDVGERFGIDPVLVHYGWRDTAYDLVFDAFGAVLIVALDLRLFVPVLERVHP